MYTDSLYNKETINKDKTYRSMYYHKINMTQKRNSVGVQFLELGLERIAFHKRYLGKGLLRLVYQSV